MRVEAPAKAKLSSTLSFHWGVFGVLLIFCIMGAIAYELSSHPVIVPLHLLPNETVKVSVFRVLPATLEIQLRFTRPSGEAKGMGSGGTRYSFGGGLCHLSPGEPITVLAESDGQRATYEALPNGIVGGTLFIRDLTPYSDRENLRNCTWPPNNSLRPLIRSGFSTVSITVTDVGRELIGEQATMVIVPPVGFKSTAQDYGLIWFFMFWPVYAFLLLIYMLVLWFMTAVYRAKEREHLSGI